LSGSVAEDGSAADELAAGVFALPAHLALGFLVAPEASALAGAADSRRILLTQFQRSPYVDTNGAWDVYEASLPRKFVANLHRRRRHFAETGELSLDVEDGRERLYELLE